jgi:tape measure domain-containing protein
MKTQFMALTSDRFTAQDSRQRVAEKVPGFFTVLAEAFGTTTADMHGRIEDGQLTKLDTIEALAQLVIDLKVVR